MHFFLSLLEFLVHPRQLSSLERQLSDHPDFIPALNAKKTTALYDGGVFPFIVLLSFTSISTEAI